LRPTLENLASQATGEYEIIVGLDGYEPGPMPVISERITYYHEHKPIGMRAMINKLSQLAKGEYLLKIDAHCIVSKGFDEELSASCEHEWIMIPRQYSLDGESFTRNPKRKHVDYWYMTAPVLTDEHKSLSTKRWYERRNDLVIDDTMSFQGSFWFMRKAEFIPYNVIDYGSWAMEAVELGNKFRLRGGRVVVNKKIWYAHLFKGKKYRRKFPISKSTIYKSVDSAYKHWMVDNKEFMKRLVEKFNPPTWENFDWSQA